MSEIQLRPYQRKFIDDIRNEFRSNNRHVVGVAPCGAGKTIMTGWMIRESLNRGKKSIFFVHRKELIDQTSETFSRLDIEHGIIASGVPMNLDLPVQIASVQTLARRLNDVPKPDFLICDECHHILANTYKKIIDKFPDAYLLGVTATPLRMGGITLNDIFDRMVISLSVNELIQLGNLTRFEYFAPETDIDLSRVRVQYGEYNQRDLANAVISKEIIGSIVDNYLEYAADKSAICYCVNVEHSEEVAYAFSRAGIKAAHVDGNTPKKLRAQLVESFRQGEIKILCNAELFGEGFDVPHCQAVILARPTKSLTLYIQQALRPLRPDPNDPNKVAVIIDQVRNHERHGLPNEEHEWTLDPNQPRFKCPHCGEFIFPIKKGDKRFCPKCKEEIPKGIAQPYRPRKHDTKDGDIIEIEVNFDDVSMTSNTVVSKPTTIEEFADVAKRKGYKLKWAMYKALEVAKNYEDLLHIAKFMGYKPGWAWHQWNDKIAKEHKSA